MKFVVAGTLLISAHALAQDQIQSMPRKDGSVEVPTGSSAPSKALATAPARAPVVIMPKALTTPVDYPADGSESAGVLLEITVDKQGRASNPELLDGREPFAAAALAAVDNWRFSPATRDGATVDARIRFVVRFTPPRVELAPERERKPAAATPVVPLASRAPSHPVRRGKQTNVLEVTVTGERPEAAVVSMGRSDVEQMPGAFGDPFRAIDALPGVTPIVSGLPFFFIRGAPPGNQGYFFDGIRVPLLYHVAAGPSVINPALVDRVDMYAGGYPARYGRFAGAIIAGESKDPASEYHAQGSVRLVDAGGYVTAPVGRGVVALGGRYSYTGAVVSLIVPEVKIEYWDYQAKAVQYLSERDTVSVFAFGALDLVQDKTNNTAEGLAGTEFHRADLRYQRVIDDGTRLRTAVTVGLDKTLAVGAMTVRDRMLATRSDLEHRLGERATLRVGVDAALDAYGVTWPVPAGSSFQLRTAIPPRTDKVAGAWVDLAFEPSRGVKVVPGLRLDHYWSGAATALAVEPRVSATFAVRKYLRLVHALGVAQQPPSFVVPVPGFQVSGLEDGLQRSLQSSSGVEVDLLSDITAGATVFQNAFFNVTDQLSAINRPTGQVDKIDTSMRARGRTFGAELLVRRSFSQRIGGLLSYTLSKSWRTFDGVRVPAAFDRRHVLQAALAFNLGRNWRSSIRGVVYSGIPSHADTVVSAVGNVDVRLNAEYLPRTPAYWRLDLRLQKRWLVGNRGAHWALTFEVLNTTLNREAVSQFCSPESCRASRIGPITIPSIGVEAAY